MRREGEGAGGWRCRSLKAPSRPGIPQDLSGPPSTAQPPRGCYPPLNPQKTTTLQPHYLSCSINALQAAVCSRTAGAEGDGVAKATLPVPLTSPRMVLLLHKLERFRAVPAASASRVYPAIPRLRSRTRRDLAGLRSCQRCHRHVPGPGLLLPGPAERREVSAEGC